MIYPVEADIVQFVKSLTQSLQPYAHANDANITFLSNIKKRIMQYQPFLLSQSLIHLICNMANLLPSKSEIQVRLIYCPENENLQIEIENTGINLTRVNGICTKNMYLFIAYPLTNGTVYRLSLPLGQYTSTSNKTIQTNTFNDNLPRFYLEIKKRLRSHFTQEEKLTETLAKTRPQEAVFLQKINALIKANLENESFDTNYLCKSMSLSRTQLFRRLKSLIRQAPANYIKTMRLQRAKELLETTDLTISEVAFKSGFQTISHFTKVFQKKYSILPSVYRRSNKSATNE